FTKRSPRLPRAVGTPLPLKRRSSPCVTPGGIASGCSPSRVAIVYSAPRSASESLTESSVMRLGPSFLKRESLCTWIFTYKSPAGPPATASPRPERRTISPPSMPAGTAMSISSCLRYTPPPRQVAHFSLGILPVPWHWRHCCTMEMVPKNELLLSRTWPLPLQCLQVSIFVPGAPPEPWQVSHSATLAKSTVRLVPN